MFKLDEGVLDQTGQPQVQLDQPARATAPNLWLYEKGLAELGRKHLVQALGRKAKKTCKLKGEGKVSK